MHDDGSVGGARDGVVIVGSYPPPYGGNSVHVQRLHRALARRFDVEVIDAYGSAEGRKPGPVMSCGAGARGLVRACLALRRRHPSLVHFHVSGMRRFLWAAVPMLACVRSSVAKVITIHSGSFVPTFREAPPWRRTMLRALLRHFERIIVVNEEQGRFLGTLGIEPRRMSVIPAFLPPIARESARAREALDTLATCRRIVVSSGCGLPYYGFDVLVRAVESLGAAANTGVLLCVYDSCDETYLARIVGRGARCTIVRNLDAAEFAWILERCDAYVRATDRDGDAVAIREAAFYGKSVVASDCVRRPAGSILFHTGDERSLATALLSIDGIKASATISQSERANLDAIVDVYARAIDDVVLRERRRSHARPK
ncbi:MAG: hypothetical protein NVS2B8_03320 [Vulcanimicrobiaceae bacterium]